jgi:hypothetical protein
MKTNCPNKSHPDFKKLVEEFGELDATYAYFLNEDDIPSVEVAGKLLGKESNNSKITSKDRIIWGHPGLGKTFARESRTDILDFDTDYKKYVNLKYNLEEGNDVRNEWRKTNAELWNNEMRSLWEQAKLDSKNQNKKLVVSDMLFLRENSSDFDKIITTDKETFIDRSKQRGDYNDNTESWKNNIDIAISNIPKEKIISTNLYFSELFENTDLKPVVNSQRTSFSSPRLTPLQSLLTDLNSKAGITSSPANNLIVGGLINEQYILNNEVSISELAPLFYDTITSIKANREKLMSMVEEGFDKMNYADKLDYLANNQSLPLKDFLTNEAIKILNSRNVKVDEKSLLYDVIGKHNDIKYIQYSKTRNTGSVRPIQGTLDKSKQTEAQKKISENFEKTDEIYDDGNPYVEVSVADFIKAGGNPVLAKGVKTITRYRLKVPINGRNFALKRTSDLQKEIVNKWKTEQEIEFQEKSSEIMRTTGTSLHTIMEDVIKYHLVNYDDRIFKTIIDNVSKGGNFKKQDVASLQKAIYNELIKEPSFQKQRKEYLDSPQNPFKSGKKSSDDNYDKLIESIIGDYISILKIQVNKDWKTNKDLTPDKQVWNRANVYTERKVYEDGKQDGGGTMDLVVVYSDGDYGILDYKFISAQTKKGDKTIGEDAFVLNVDELQKAYMSGKERSYDAQLSSYSEVMTKVYGAKNLVFARIKPTYLKYTTNEKGKIDNDSKVATVFTSEEAFGLIPISKERTGNKNLDVFLDKLVNQTNAISKDLTDRRAWTTDFITLNRLVELKKITMSIQKEGDISLYTKYATMFLETMRERMEDRVDSFDRSAVIEATNELDFIRYFLKNTTGIMEEYVKNFPDLVDGFKADIGIILTKVNDVDAKLSELRILRMREEANAVGIDDKTFNSYENAKDISGIQQMMLGMKSVNHVFHQTFARRIELMNAERIMFQRKIQDELSVKLEELSAWGKRKGLSGSDVFAPLLNERKDMITPWNDDFIRDMESRKDMSNATNVKWFEDNFHRSKDSVNGRPSDEDRFQRAKKNLFDKLEAAYGNQDSAKDRIESIKKEWLRKNDINHPEFIGWSHTQYKSPKNPEKYYNEKYKDMMKPENKPLRDFYEYSIKMNYIFRDMMGDAVDLKYNFVANIHKTMLDTMSQDGVALGGVFSKYWNSLMNSTMNDPKDKMGSDKKEIPILFVDYVPTADKSVDLGKSLMLFATFVNNYKHAVDLSEIYNMGRRILIETPLVALDSKGNKVKSIRQVGKFEPAVALAGTESNLVKSYDNYANVYAYGEHTKQDAISEFLGEKGVKRLAAVRKYVSRSSMSFNILSAAVGSLNTNLQLYSFSANGKYFTSAQVANAQKAVGSFNAKLAFAEIFFETNPQLSETEVKAGAMSANELVKKFSKDPVYVFQRWFDNLDEKVILHCMMNNYGINPETGQVERLDKLKEKFENDPSYANFEWKSVWDSMEEFTNAKGEKEMRIVNQHTGKSITPKYGEKLVGDELKENNKNMNTFMSMRRVTMNMSSRVKGTQSSEDTASWKHTVIGQVFGQFRTWMVPTVNERLKREQYNMSMDEFEVGRWTAIYNVAGNSLLNSCKLLAKSLIPFINKDFDDDTNVKMKEMYDLFIENNPDFADKVSFKDYIGEYKGQMRSLAREIKIFAGILLVHAALIPLLFPGDDDEDKGIVFNSISSVLGRLTTELGFYLPFTPHGASEFKKLISRDPMPLTRALDDVGNIVGNTYDETRDLIFGEDSNRDKTPALYYGASVFGMKNAFKYIGITDTDDKTNSIWEWLTDDNEHSRK